MELSSQPKVLILLDKNPFTSFGRIAMSYVEALKSQFDVKVCYLTSPEYFKENQKLDGYQIHSPKFMLGYWYYSRGLQGVLKDFQPHHVIAIRPELGFLIPKVKKVLPKTKTTVMVHDMFAETLYPKSWKYQLINKFFINPMLAADGFVYNSKYSQQETQTHYRSQDLQIPSHEAVVGCVIHREDFYPLNVEASELKRQKGLSGPVYLTLCLDEPRKNIQTFLDIAQAKPEAQFIRIGKESPWIEEYLEQNSIGNVKHYFELSLEEIREFYNLADALVYTSYLEGFGYPPLEALACGTQVVSSDTSALSENLQGVAYLVKDPDDVKAFIEGMNELKQRPLPGGMKRVDEFSIHEFRKKLLGYLQTLDDV